MEHMRLDHHRKASAEHCPAPVLADAPGDDELALALARTQRVAVVGCSPNPSRTSYQIAVWLMENTPYELYLVNPAANGEEIRGHGFYDSLAELPVAVDLVDVFRRAEFTPAIAAAAVDVHAKALWLQLGITHPDAMATARGAGMVAVQNRCIKVEYRRLADRIESFRAL
ncbi:CoA-binding protein [Demequina maris]|uniref:CoA-binding protein n=1 Tax=Demequina maris TaxID=1638982 RepID=UPI000782D125|nr:CoA-binding protein [Demequina maris]